uniref:Uncharacterized protein n=1 Tax=Ixodes ricinus TaxID=34613 RepID=A0A147BL76_IXORI
MKENVSAKKISVLHLALTLQLALPWWVPSLPWLFVPLPCQLPVPVPWLLLSLRPWLLLSPRPWLLLSPRPWLLLPLQPWLLPLNLPHCQLQTAQEYHLLNGTLAWQKMMVTWWTSEKVFLWTRHRSFWHKGKEMPCL